MKSKHLPRCYFIFWIFENFGHKFNFMIINHFEFWSYDKLLIVNDVYLTNNILPKMFSWLRDAGPPATFCPLNDPIFLPSDSGLFPDKAKGRVAQCSSPILRMLQSPIIQIIHWGVFIACALLSLNRTLIRLKCENYTLNQYLYQ